MVVMASDMLGSLQVQQTYASNTVHSSSNSVHRVYLNPKTTLQDNMPYRTAKDTLQAWHTHTRQPMQSLMARPVQQQLLTRCDVQATHQSHHVDAIANRAPSHESLSLQV